MSTTSTIKIPRGNDFSLHFPLVMLTQDGEQDITAADLTDIHVNVGRGSNITEYAFTQEDNEIVVAFDETLARGMYDVHIAAKLQGRDIASHLKECFAIVDWNKDANFKDYLFEQSQRSTVSVFIGSSVIDPDLESLKAEYMNMLRIAELAKKEAEQAKAESDNAAIGFAKAAVALEGVAQESTLNRNTERVLEAINNIREVTTNDIDNLF